MRSCRVLGVLERRSSHDQSEDTRRAGEVVRRLSNEEPLEGCLGELRAAASELDRKGFWWRPSCSVLHEGRRRPQTETREPGEWPHGWQCWASSVLDAHQRKNSMLTNRSASRQAHLRSHSGRNAGVVFSHAPTTTECAVPPHLFRMLARVCREAGARVKFNAYLRDMNLGVPRNDEGRIEVLAQDLPCFNGAQLAVDITLLHRWTRMLGTTCAVAFAESLATHGVRQEEVTPSLAELLTHDPR